MTSGSGHGNGTATSIRQVLMDEHRLIEQVLDAIDGMLIEGSFDAGFLTGALDFLRNFADGCHHEKEEQHLFPALELAGVPRVGGPIDCMLQDHDEGRGLLRVVESNLAAAGRGENPARTAVCSALRRYVEMLRRHIEKEDNILFVIAENMLPPDRRSRMLKDFERQESSPAQIERREHYVNLARTLNHWKFGRTTVDA